MDAGTMKDYIEDLIQQVTTAAQVMQESADEIKRLRAENDGLKIRIITLLKKLENESKR
jgi:regulator of replication initiation timing